MFDLIKRIYDTNPINRLYNEVTGKDIFGVGVDGDETGESGQFVINLNDGYFQIMLAVKNGIEFDAENATAIVDDTETTFACESFQMDAEIVALVNEYYGEYGFNLDSSYIGGYFYLGTIGSVENYYMQGVHTVELVDDNDVQFSTAYEMPLMYMFKKIVPSWGGENDYYLVALRNSNNWDDFNYTGLTFYLGGETTDKIGVSEQDPSVPVTFSVEYTLEEMSEASAAQFQGFETAVGFELYTYGVVNGAAKYTYGDDESNGLYINGNLIDFNTLSNNKFYVVSGNTAQITDNSGKTLTDFISVSGGGGYLFTYTSSVAQSVQTVQALEFDSGKTFVNLIQVYQQAMSPNYDENWMLLKFLNNNTAFLRIQWEDATTSNESLTLGYTPNE